MLATREELREKGARYSFARHATLIHLVALAFVGPSLALVRDLRPVELVAVPLTFLFANLVEYVAHRWPMHHVMRPLGILFARHTAVHHAYFRTDSMRIAGASEMRFVAFPWWAAGLTLLVSSPLGLAIAALGSPNAGLLYVATATLYYLTYEWLHASYHVFGPERLARVPLLGHAAARHALHHDPERMTEVNFNITFPIVDHVVGTASRVNCRRA